MIPEGIKQKSLDKALAEIIAYLVLEKGMSYKEIVGETIEGEIVMDGKRISIRLVREGIPIQTLIELVRYNKLFNDKKRVR